MINQTFTLLKKMSIAFVVAVTGFILPKNIEHKVLPILVPANQIEAVETEKPPAPIILPVLPAPRSTVTPISSSSKTAVTAKKIGVKKSLPPKTEVKRQPAVISGQKTDKIAATGSTTPDSGVQSPAATSSPPRTQTPADFTGVNEKVIETIVNILCITKAGGYFEPMSGSGVLIDKRGVILTNAHIAQYFLLKDFPTADNIECAIRTGNPASPKYRAKLVYLSERWIKDNYAKIKLEKPKGTGQDDFGILKITSGITDSVPVPAEFPFMPMDTSDNYLRENRQILTVGYPASFLGGILIQMDLARISSFGVIKQIYTFSEKTPDLFSIEGSLLAQQGSSGGAAVGGDGRLIGLIVTVTEADKIGSRWLQSITLSHINRSLIEQTGTVIDAILGNLDGFASEFNEKTFPALKKILTDEILKT
jgi:S1-C subfamily serine protease